MANTKLNGWIWRVACIILGIAFGAGGAIASLNHLNGRVNDHETRIRAVEKGITEANGKLDFLVGQAKEAP